MGYLRIIGGLVLPALLAGCGPQPETNLATAHNVEDADITVPVNTAGNDDDIANAAAPAGPALNLAPDGLTLVTENGSARQIAFGTERDMAMKMVAASVGDPVAEAANPECGAGPLDSAAYKGELKLYFQDGRFVGWDLDGRGAGPFATATGVTIGSTRAQMEQAIGLSVEESSLGHEFDAGGLQGLLTSARPEGKVTRSVGGNDLHLSVIEAAGSGDAAAVVALWHVCGLTRPWNDPEADFARALGGSGSTVLVARDGGAILGSAVVGDDGHRGWVYYLAVAEAARGRGLGRALMTAAEAWLRGRGCPKLQLMVREDNGAALGFYEALGLERQGVVTLGRFLR